ncbi:outer membrane protein assembly factor BamE [Litoreibacter roseus]|uniref:Outer membrane protein assembly factor BamE n=1 Tax=Litoreibacter roseus TaxID=2601869 RepID=A0A6N6JEI2_9RHOB|nr:outer membrane protein assembly factor BamE [Litoreibacter roseus]GFE63622.1 outer membrane protein assembly factor BamE [Litoreibacter roseus]
MVSVTSRKSKRLFAGMCFSMALFASGCSEVIRNHGYAPSEVELQDIVVGADTRGTVEDVVGRPSTSGVLQAGAWYYVGSTIRHYGYRAPREIDRQVVAITFSEDDTVQNIERFGLERGQVVTLSRRVTETSVRDFNIIQQLLRNFGRIDLGEIVDGDQ